MALPDHGAIRQAASLVEQGFLQALDEYAAGQLPDEDRVVARMLTRARDLLSGSTIRGLRWEAGILSSQGPKAQESRHGADFIGVFEASLDDYHVVKGFLGQAKLLKHGNALGGKERRRLREQCQKMLKRSPDSFVFIIQPHSVTILPAISVVAGDNEPLLLYQRGVKHFFEEHFACFVGDGRLASSDTRSLDQLPELLARSDARRLLYVSASSDSGLAQRRVGNPYPADQPTRRRMSL